MEQVLRDCNLSIDSICLLKGFDFFERNQMNGRVGGAGKAFLAKSSEVSFKTLVECVCVCNGSFRQGG